MTNDIKKEDYNDIIDIISSVYGHDFSGYSHASFKRRLLRFMKLSGIVEVGDFKQQLLSNAINGSDFIEALTVNTTEMFRDPMYYKEVNATILPMLASYPIINIWHAGCSNGEEVFSMAILLHEAGLLGRARIYATDINAGSIEKARSGIIPIGQMKEYTYNYMQAGGKSEFSNYYTARYEHAIINKDLRKNIVFSQHNLVTDASFKQFQLICCRNVLIYFNKELQNKVFHLFYQSLSPLGYLTLGSRESLLFSDLKHKFETVNSTHRIYRRTN